MACNLSAGFTRDCSDSVGGIEELYLLPRDSVSTFTESGHEITAITDGGATWYKYELKKEVGSIVATTTIDPANGTRFSEGVVAFSINKFSATKSNELRLMVLGRLAIIVKDNNGVYWGLGFQSYAEGQSLVANTGTSVGDRSGYDIELMSKEAETPYEVSAATIATLTIDV